jgi:hypothetical protein
MVGSSAAALQPKLHIYSNKSDDGVRLWVNGVKLIDDWNIYSVKIIQVLLVSYRGRKYDIVLEYYENVGQAVSKLYWNSTSQAKEIDTIAVISKCNLRFSCFSRCG